MNKEIIIDGVRYAPVKETEKINTTIRNRFDGSTIFESEQTSFREAVIDAIKSEVSLIEADLSGANLIGINFSNIDLTRVDFTGANLAYVDFTDADLVDVNFINANLTFANLTNTDLTGVNLAGANITGCIYYMGDENKNFEALCKAIKTIKWNDKTGADFIK